MNLTLIGNVNELSANEQKTLYTEGADIYTGIYYLIAEADQFSQTGKDVVPNTPALRALSLSFLFFAYVYDQWQTHIFV